MEPSRSRAGCMSATPEIGYIVKMFPRLSETFIRNEILELENQGLVLRIFSLKKPAHAEAGQCGAAIRSAIHYLPDRTWREPWRVLLAQWRVLLAYPRGYVRTLVHVLQGRELRSLGRGLRRFCQTCCLVSELGPVRHLHAHFATDPTRLASWARMICGISFSVTTHAKDLYQDNRIASPGLRFKLSSARFVIANSRFSAAGLRSSFNGSCPTRILTVYNSLDLAAFPMRSEEPQRRLRILSVGRLIEKKGFPDLLKACQFLKERGVQFDCEIIGSGSMREQLVELIKNLGLEKTVVLRGQQTHQDMLEHYRNATVFALPCVVAANGDRDILPNVLKEAMAVGVPVVTTRLPGTDELIEDRVSGLIIEPGDVPALADSLEQLLHDPELRKRLAGQGRKVIEQRFDRKTNFAVLRDLLLEADAGAYESAASTLPQSVEFRRRAVDSAE